MSSSSSSSPPSSVTSADYNERMIIEYGFADLYFLDEAQLDSYSEFDGFARSPASSSVDIVYIGEPGQLSSLGRPAMARTSEWVQQQSAQDQTDTPEGALHNLPVTPPPRSSSRERQSTTNGPHQADLAIGRGLQKQKYDIQTLLSMRYIQGTVPVMLRVKPEAIAENIFQYLGVTTSRRLPTRSRGLSDISNASRASIASNTNLTNRLPLGLKYPNVSRLQRQAPDPIEIPSTQRQDGFVRFLQQHASPPHHRVTAGGRIVPAGPTSPPPMLDYGSLNGLVRERLQNTEMIQNDGRPRLSALKPQLPGNTSTMTRGLPHQASDMASRNGFASSSTRLPESYDNLAYGYQPMMASVMQGPAAMVPLGAFPDGSTLVSYNGMNYRTYWNGINTVIEPIQSLSMPNEGQNYPAAYPQLPYTGSNYGPLSQSIQTSNLPTPLTNITNGSRGSTRKTSDSLQDQAPSDKESEMRTQLADLDKYLALYHYDIAQAERAELVAQRRYLVEAIDKVRVSKEKSKRSIPIIVPKTGLPTTPLPKISSDVKGDVPRPPGLGRTIPRDQTNGKGLSPAAVPFVPSSIRNLPSDLSTKRTLEHIASAAIARKDRVSTGHDPSGSTQVASHREESTSSVLDSSDPAMRVVDYEDIEYASRYLYNWNLDKKVYCTTVAEFQEAVRRVREQARHYGCLGGQSKDPAYDAEQDIWWAICDRDPIPLPTEVPDHVSNPRPWDWADSAFNFRLSTASLAGNGIDDARRSPRLLGWDPAATEKMKDKFDVTRSYYAFRGQLPSVLFRTWAYDRRGNKVAIESSPQPVTRSTLQQHHTDRCGLPSNTKDDTQTNVGFSSRVLQTLSMTEVNSRDAGRKDVNKLQVDEEDGVRHSSQVMNRREPSQSPVKLEPEFQCKLTCHSNNAVNASSEARNCERTPHRYQTYFEDSPDIPASRCSNLGRKGLVSPENTREDQHAISGSETFSYTKYASPDLADQSAETRSQWGPEEVSNSVEHKGSDGDRVGAAKVNIPIAEASRPPINHNIEVDKGKPSNLGSSQATGAHHLLRKMLQHPTHTSAKPPTGITSGLANRLSRFLTGGVDSALRTHSKENDLSREKVRPLGSRVSGKDGRSGLASAFKSDANISVVKAQSSLAPSTYQAHEYLPHINESGKDPSSTGSLHYQGGDGLSSQQIHVNLPSSASHHGQQVFPTSSIYQSSVDRSHQSTATNYHTPVHFAFDGGADPQPSQGTEHSKIPQQSIPDFDCKGLTHADYENKREDHDNTWHKGAVKDFFQELAANERQEIMSQSQSSAKPSV